MTTRLHPLPDDAIAQLVTAAVEKLTAARMAKADVVLAATIFGKVLRRARVGVNATPSSNGHHPSEQGD